MRLLLSDINWNFLASTPDIVLCHHFILSTCKLDKLTEWLNIIIFTFSVTGQYYLTHSFTILNAMLYSRLNDLIFPVKNPLWVILDIWDVFKKLFLLSNYRAAYVLPKSVNEFFIGSFYWLKWNPKSVLKNVLVLSSISRIYWGAFYNLWFISDKWANFLRLSAVSDIFPLIFRSSTLLLRIVRVSRCKYSLNLTATKPFLLINWPTLGISKLMLLPARNCSEKYLMIRLIPN